MGCLMHKMLYDNNLKIVFLSVIINWHTTPTVMNDTRFSSQYCLVLPQPKKEYFKRSFCYNGIKIWNKIHFTIKSVENITSF